MCKTLTIKGLIAILAIAFNLQTAFSQAAFWSETFATPAAFSAWTAASTGAGTEVWNRSTDPAINMGFSAAPVAFGATTAADGFAFYNSDANGQANIHDVTLTSQPINCASHTNVGLRFSSQFADFQGSDVEVRVSTNGGTTWISHPIFDDQPSYGSVQNALVPAVISSSFSIPEANAQAQVWIQFRWVGEWEYAWKLDDVELFDYVAPTASVTFKVNAALLTVDPAGMKIAGTFNNFADANMTNEGNGVWSYTASGLVVGTEVLYKFKNGPSGWESGQAACGVADGFGGFNRNYTPASAIPATLPAVCFNACVGCVVSCAQNPNSIICDNLDTYVTTLKLGPQATWWTTWSGTEGTTEDGIVSTEQAASAPNSLKIVSTVAGGGPQDVVLDLGDKATGNYSLKWKMFIPTGKQGYFNVQNVVPIVPEFNLEAFFDANGAGRVVVATAELITFTYPNGAWFTVEQKIDLDNNTLKLYINNVLAGSIPYPNNIGGIDFYGTNASALYYIDDVEFVSLPPIVYNVDICDAAVDLTPLFGGAPSVAQTSALFDNTTATASPTDPTLTATCWFETSVTNSQWFNFPGDGKRYHIETVPCNATNYINAGADNLGDTQMAIYTGTDCSSLTLADCIDDLFTDGMPDWRAGLDIETVAGENYYMLIDGYKYTTAGASLGEFCVEVTQLGSVSCDQGVVGAVTNSEFLCYGDTTSFSIDEIGTIIPTVGPIYGMAWAISSAPVPAGTWPPDAPGFIAGFRVSSTVFTPALANDGSIAFLPPAAGYYFTPVVLGGGVNATGNPDFLQNVDVTNGCFFVGESKSVFFVPDPDDLEPISGSIEAIPGPNGVLLDLSVAGGLGELIGDESFYTYLWSNGATTQDITVTGNAVYTVVISDISGCDGIQSFSAVLTDIKDPLAVKALSIAPNPTNNNFKVSLTLENALDVRAEFVNSVGQVLRTFDYGNVSRLNETIDVANYPDGVYFLRLSIDGQKTQRSVVVSH
jgi:Secretion system C-terminal sorting domain